MFSSLWETSCDLGINNFTPYTFCKGAALDFPPTLSIGGLPYEVLLGLSTKKLLQSP